MALTPGTRLGPYEILAPLGAGGMGEVYRGRDSKLDREVAIKVLPAAMARDRERLARFEREAKVLASLNHPNIAQIYGLEDSDDTRALVMELVAGATLNVPQPLATALDYAKQIADALEAAHEKGITHRDLKPANIMITPEGVVKVLDFGLASITAREPSGDPENSPTLTMGATQAGVIMGTAAYMSPEQAAGKQVDKRSDIWSFGVVLWEMLTGARLFDGETVSHTLADVLRAPIDLERLQAPAPVAELVKRCLNRDQRKRLRDIGEARLAIENYFANPASVSERRPAGKLAWIVAGVAAVIAIALGAMRGLEKPPVNQTLRYALAGPENGFIRSHALSPDGRYLVIAASSTGKTELLLRPMDSVRWQPMPFTEGAALPFWSPDSRHIGFFADGKLKRIAVTGGPAQSLCKAEMSFGGSWNPQDVIVFGGEFSGPIRHVTAKGGEPVEVPTAIGRYPMFLPDGRHFLYLRTGSGKPDEQGVYTATLDGKENRRVLGDDSSVAFAPGAGIGHVLFVRENTLMALPFDPAESRAVGDVFPVGENAGLSASLQIRASVSEGGMLISQAGVGQMANRNQLRWYDRTGKPAGEVGEMGGVSMPAISPDGKLVAYRRAAAGKSGTWDIWLRDLTRGTESRFTSHESLNGTPFWSPKGDLIVFESNRDGGKMNLFQKAASGSGQEEKILPDGNARWPTHWSPDGRYIVYNESDPKTKFDLWVLPVEGAGTERKPILFLRTEFNERLGQISPDGRWMAFTSDRSGKFQIYVRPFPAGDGEWTISVAGGASARWRGDGKELFFLTEDGKMMAVPVKATTAFEVGTPVTLFDANAISSTANTVVVVFDVTPDGKRFLMTTANRTDAAAGSDLTVVTNWDASVRK